MAIVRVCLAIFVILTILALMQSPTQTIGMWGKAFAFIIALFILGWVVYILGSRKL